MLQSVGSQRVRHNLVTEQQQYPIRCEVIVFFSLSTWRVVDIFIMLVKTVHYKPISTDILFSSLSNIVWDC